MNLTRRHACDFNRYSICALTVLAERPVANSSWITVMGTWINLLMTASANGDGPSLVQPRCKLARLCAFVWGRPLRMIFVDADLDAAGLSLLSALIDNLVELRIVRVDASKLQCILQRLRTIIYVPSSSRKVDDDTEF